MSFPLIGRRTALALAALVLPACGQNPPTAPTQPTPTTRPNVTIAATVVQGESRATGYAYRAIVNLRESAGVAATIVSIDLTFMNGAAVVIASHHDKPISDDANVVPASGALASRELMTVDPDGSHPYATAVQAKVTFTDGSFVGTATAAADIPPLTSPVTQTFTLTGVISDATTHAGIAGARIDVLTGSNAGKSATADGGGTYVIGGLAADSFRLRASAAGYNPGEQGVTVPTVPRADFELRKIESTACSYSVAPTGFLDVPAAGNQFSLTIARTSGTCGWQASTDVSWMTLSSRSGSDGASLTVAYLPNASFVGRVGTVTVEWNGGSAQVIVRQSAESPAFCLVTVKVNGQNPLNVPASGNPHFTASIDPVPGVPPGICGPWTVSASAGITLTGATSGPNAPGSFPFDVQDNASSSVRSMFLTVNFVSGSPSGSLIVNQSGK